MQILICDPNKQRAQIWSCALLKELQCEVIITHRDLNAQAYIDTLPSLDIIIAPVIVGNVEVGKNIAGSFRKKSKSLVLILFGKPKIEGEGIHSFDREPLLIHLIALIKKIGVSTSAITSEYRSVQLDLLTGVSESPVDLFFKLNEERQHFIKIYKRDSAELQVCINQYAQKKITHFWTPNEDFPKLMGAVLTNIRNSELGDSVKFPFDIETFVENQLLNLGFDELIIAHKKSLQKNLVHSFINDQRKSDVKKLLEKNNNNIIEAHGLLTGLIACLLLDDLNWANPDHYRQIYCSAQLMDHFVQDQTFLSIRSQKQFDDLKKLRGDKFQYINHAKLMSEKLESIVSIPTEIVKLIKHHHGTLKGSGFELAPENQLHSIHWLFALSEFCAHFILEHRYDMWDYAQLKLAVEEHFMGNSAVLKFFAALEKKHG